MKSFARKYVLFFPILTLLLIACDTDKDIEPSGDVEKYTFIDLKYDFSDKEEIEFEQHLKTIEYTNNSNVEQTLPIGDMSSIKNFMFFQSCGEIADHLFCDSILVNIPECIDDERIYLTKDKFLFSRNNVYLPISNLPDETFTINANSIMRININIVYLEYTIGFELSYWDNILDRKKTMTGKWKMIQFIKLRNEISETDLI